MWFLIIFSACVVIAGINGFRFLLLLIGWHNGHLSLSNMMAGWTVVALWYLAWISLVWVWNYLAALGAAS